MTAVIVQSKRRPRTVKEISSPKRVSFFFCGNIAGILLRTKGRVFYHDWRWIDSMKTQEKIQCRCGDIRLVKTDDCTCNYYNQRTCSTTKQSPDATKDIGRMHLRKRSEDTSLHAIFPPTQQLKIYMVNKKNCEQEVFLNRSCVCSYIIHYCHSRDGSKKETYVKGDHAHARGRSRCHYSRG